MKIQVYLDSKSYLDEVADYALTLDPQRDKETVIVVSNLNEKQFLVNRLHNQASYVADQASFSLSGTGLENIILKLIPPRTMDITIHGMPYVPAYPKRTLLTVNVFTPVPGLEDVKHHVGFVTHEAKTDFYKTLYSYLPTPLYNAVPYWNGNTIEGPTYVSYKPKKTGDPEEQQKLCL